MDYIKTGQLINARRKELRLTQQQLADQMHISDKTVSKWERGLGCPDVSLLPDLSNILGIDLETLLTGEPDANHLVGGNMKKIKFYVCPDCGNLLTSTADTSISCCGNKLAPLVPQKAGEQEQLGVELIEQEYFIFSDHEMLREHYLAFAAIVTGDSLVLKKLYPEWNLQIRMPRLQRGMLMWYCTRHGLFYQNLP